MKFLSSLERLVAKHAKGLDRLIIACTGSEASEVGDHLKRKLAKIDCPAMGDVRGWGLFLGMEWVSDRAEKTPDRDGAHRVVNRLKDKGFLIGTSGSHDATRKVRPPVVFGRDHTDAFVAAFEETVRELY